MSNKILFEIKMLGNESVTVKGKVFGEFGVHSFEMIGGGWRITHIHSGGAMRDFETKEAAVDAAKKLDAAKIPGSGRVRIRRLKSGKLKVTDPESALPAMKAVLDGAE